MTFRKRISLLIIILFSLSLISYAMSFLVQIGIPPFFINILKPTLSVVLVALILQFFFKKYFSKEHSWIKYIPFALAMSVLRGIAIRIVGEISPVVSNLYFDSSETTVFLLNLVTFLQFITRIILTYYFISIIETIVLEDLEEINLSQNTNKGKLYFLVDCFFNSIVFCGVCFFSLREYLKNNAMRIILFVFVTLLLMIGIASWCAMIIINYDIGFNNERLVECSWCSGKGKVWKGTKGWLPCDRCGGTGLIGW